MPISARTRQPGQTLNRSKGRRRVLVWHPAAPENSLFASRGSAGSASRPHARGGAKASCLLQGQGTQALHIPSVHFSSRALPTKEVGAQAAQAVAAGRRAVDAAQRSRASEASGAEAEDRHGRTMKSTQGTQSQ
ncbi:unnamed protein product [Symbiodinium natans]|uniref:Uncharacterized protein n=1 Tax=Symbiodinium natans TaxID=878477 RepID=A0A812TRH3_9DINO|nr:unnamed protein product [Symbiodinium natans]